MNRVVKLLSAGTLAALVAMPVVADEPFEAEVEARKAHMQLAKYNMTVLGGMAKGKRDYDADIASAVAQDMLAVATMNNMTLWPEGSDNSVDGVDTKARPDIWAEGSDIMDKHLAWVEASETMAEDAGKGPEALKKAIGALGKSCKGCHKAYKAK